MLCYVVFFVCDNSGVFQHPVTLSPYIFEPPGARNWSSASQRWLESQIWKHMGPHFFFFFFLKIRFFKFFLHVFAFMLEKIMEYFQSSRTHRHTPTQIAGRNFFLTAHFGLSVLCLDSLQSHRRGVEQTLIVGICRNLLHGEDCWAS